MAILDPLYAVYNALFAPLLQAGGLYTGALLTIGLISVVLAVILTLLYKFLTDNEERKRLKEKAKEYKEKADEARKNDNDEKMQKYMEQSMKVNKDMFKMNLKPMAVSFAIVLLIFPWMSNVFTPSATLHATTNTSFTGNFTYQGETVDLTAEQTLIEELDETRLTVETSDGTTVVNAQVQDDELTVLDKEPVPVGSSDWEVKNMQRLENTDKDGTGLQLQLSLITVAMSLPLIGNLEWLGFYILISIPLTFGLRKAMGVD